MILVRKFEDTCSVLDNLTKMLLGVSETYDIRSRGIRGGSISSEFLAADTCSTASVGNAKNKLRLCAFDTHKQPAQFGNFTHTDSHLAGRYSDSIRIGRSGDRIPVEARFSAPVQTGPGAYPASRTIGIGSRG